MIIKPTFSNNNEIPLSEYPRPQFKRDSYLSLNGYWDYAITNTCDKPYDWQGKILVPYSPETELSTVNKLLNRFIDYKKIQYCEETREVFLMNWIKHNKIVSPKVKKCVYEELKKIKSIDMVNLFLEECERFGYTLDKNEIKIDTPMDRVSIPIPKVTNNFEYGYGEKEKEKEKQKQNKNKKRKKKVLKNFLFSHIINFKF
jgi:hypothetical protein